MEQNLVIRTILADRDRLFAYIWSILGNVHLTEDVLQEVTVVAIEKAGEIENEFALRAWLRTAARLKSLEAIRAAKRHPISVDGEVLDQIEQAWERLDSVQTSDLSEALEHCVAKLTPNNRKLVKLRYVDALKSAEIAEQLGRKVTAVYQGLTRTHRALAQCLRRRLGASDGQ